MPIADINGTQIAYRGGVAGPGPGPGPGAGHASNLTHPAQVNPPLLAFLASLAD